MSSAYAKDMRVLAIDPSTRGFGFVVLEGPERLVDWGVKETKKNKNARTLKLIEDLMNRYQPSVLSSRIMRAKVHAAASGFRG